MNKIFSFFSIFLIAGTGCSSNKITTSEVNMLHAKYALSSHDLKMVANAGCKNFKGGSGRSKGLTGYVNTSVSVKMIGKIKKTYTKNPFGTSELVTDTAGTLLRAIKNGNKRMPIYKGKCQVTKVITQNSTYLGRSAPKDQHESTIYNFVINPKICLAIKKNPRKYLNRKGGAECFAMDTSLSGFSNTLGDNFSNILKGKK